MSVDVCADANITGEASQMQAIDVRDNKVYWITKMPDDNCWMTQNLDHDIDHTYTYSSANTDIPGNWNETLNDTYATYTGAYDYTIENSLPWDGTFLECWAGESGDECYARESDYQGGPGTGITYPESYDPGDLCWKSTVLFSWDIATPPFESCGNNTTAKHYHIGNFYNLAATVATSNINTYINGLSYLQEYEEDGGGIKEADQSICPAGWTLPRSTENYGPGSMRYMVNQLGLTTYGDVNLHLAPTYFTLAGEYDPAGYFERNYCAQTNNTWCGTNVAGIGLLYSGNEVIYRSAMIDLKEWEHMNGGYFVSYGEGEASAGESGVSYYKGFSIRCVAEQTWE